MAAGTRQPYETLFLILLVHFGNRFRAGLLKRADEAMYKAKSDGGNQVVCYELETAGAIRSSA